MIYHSLISTIGFFQPFTMKFASRISFAFHSTRYFMDTKFKNIQVSSDDHIGSLNHVIKIFSQNRVNLSYSRTNFTSAKKNLPRKYRIDLSYENNPEININNIISELQKQSFLVSQQPALRVPWFPKNLEEVNTIGNHLMDMKEPFEDNAYKIRRDSVASKSFGHRMGNVIPDVEYAKEENDLWVNIYKKTKPLQEQRMSQVYLSNRNQLEKVFPLERQIPQLQDLSTYLEGKTGFRIKPIHGMISSSQFLNCLAFKIFCSTQYIRNWKTPDYTFEPDIIHEFIGHMPTLADPNIAEISQKIGLLSLGASPSVIKKLASIYFLILQFGTIKSGNKFFGYGAGFPGCMSQLENMTSNKIKYKRFDPFVDCLRTFPLQDIQPLYLYTQSLEETISLIEDFGKTLEKSISAIYNEQTQEIQYDRNIECFEQQALEKLAKE